MSYTTGKVLFDAWSGEITSPDPPLTWSAGDPVFESIEVEPGRIILLGGAPGSGKTALLMQWALGILTHNPDLRVLVANVEMPPHALLTRQLSRLSGIPLTTIRKRQVAPADYKRLGEGLNAVKALIDRLAFSEDPHRLDSIATDGADFGADLILVDYLQRIDPAGKADGLRERINRLMSKLRRLADKGGIGILAAAALTRSRDSKGRGSYDGQHLSLASFRESSELEYGSDECLLLFPTDEDQTAPVRSMMLSHAKSRYGEQRDVALTFHRRFQRFEVDTWSMAASSSPPPAMVGRSAARNNGKAF
jgi:replicative DNA helicase